MAADNAVKYVCQHDFSQKSGQSPFKHALLYEKGSYKDCRSGCFQSEGKGDMAGQPVYDKTHQGPQDKETGQGTCCGSRYKV